MRPYSRAAQGACCGSVAADGSIDATDSRTVLLVSEYMELSNLRKVINCGRSSERGYLASPVAWNNRSVKRVVLDRGTDGQPDL
jgi:hypothetical protein